MPLKAPRDAAHRTEMASVSENTEISPKMNEDEVLFWKRAFLKALPDCLDVEKTPDYCAHIASEVADASVREYRRRVK